MGISITEFSNNFLLTLNTYTRIYRKSASIIDSGVWKLRLHYTNTHAYVIVL